MAIATLAIATVSLGGTISLYNGGKTCKVENESLKLNCFKKTKKQKQKTNKQNKNENKNNLTQ